MSTPAAAALNGPGGGAAGGGSGAGGAAGGTPVVQPGAGGGGAGSPGGGAGAGGAANQPYFDTWLPAAVPENKDARDWLANKNFADPATLVKSYRAIETEAATLRAAANLKAYPADKVDDKGNVVTKADPNAVQAWRTAMGVPATAADYKITPPANTPFPQFTGYLAEVLHDAGVPAAMAPKLVQGYEAAVARLEAELKTTEDRQSESALNQLKMDWGSNYQERMALAGRGKDWLAKEVGGLNEMQMRTLESVLSTPKFLAAMWKIGAANGEGNFAGGGGGGGGFENSAAAAQAELDQLTADRTAGKITDFTWKSKEFQDRITGLQNRIVAGMAQQ
jgi:hypothetical protein